VLRYFEVRLLHTSGFGPELSECVECRTALEPATHLFCPAAGGILCTACGPSAKGSLVPLSVNAIKVLRFFQREPPDAVDALEVPTHVLRETARALRSYTTYVLERDLKSARFMNLVAAE
jgi:DNA repair protein RecO (recombination protein O)